MTRRMGELVVIGQDRWRMHGAGAGVKGRLKCGCCVEMKLGWVSGCV